MPMLAGYERVRDAVARAVAGAGVSLRRLEQALPDAEWQCWLVHSIRTASFVVADVTDHNPFVMYELGLAHGRELPTLLIVDSKHERIPATVLGSPFLTYNNCDLDRFEEELTAWIVTTADTLRLPSRQLSGLPRHANNRYYYARISRMS